MKILIGRDSLGNRNVAGKIIMKSILRKCFHVAECRITYRILLEMEIIFKIILSKQQSNSQVRTVAFRITLQATWGSAQLTSNL